MGLGHNVWGFLRLLIVSLVRGCVLRHDGAAEKPAACEPRVAQVAFYVR